MEVIVITFFTVILSLILITSIIFIVTLRMLLDSEYDKTLTMVFAKCRVEINIVKNEKIN